ncbi:gamma-glutamyl-gamma-aminobutyrate hydrolase family protein [Bradyrhizobium sp. SZCCHNRI20481]|uniref:gamma-glutamyl-gamma-aminobutyrate hydrolase family protein n=1 Tax=Bradyrhizobium sp. SZCCHNRI20481 TaxID=3057286 RepID=UPI0029161E7A|nr:gamma-glutamyl-gamma-aminobutyrate hydrolase family protein [Bradyrhizobium sp. SZCCHNRI20481]
MLAALTMRVDRVEHRDEERDGLDRRWLCFLATCGLRCLPLPNCPTSVAEIIRRSAPDVIVLTGGGDVAAVSGTFGIRDQVEALLLEWAAEHGKPVIGVCRGMQVIMAAAGAKLVRVSGHVRARHRLLPSGRIVNSYHDYAAADPPTGFVALQRSDDGLTEACRDTAGRILGIMWHPEREDPFDDQDKRLFASHLFGGDP